MFQRAKAVLMLLTVVGLTACDSRLHDTYVSTSDPARFYEFTFMGKWQDESGAAGTYTIEGGKIVVQGSTDLPGEVLSKDEVRLYDVPDSVDREFTLYRRRVD